MAKRTKRRLGVLLMALIMMLSITSSTFAAADYTGVSADALDNGSAVSLTIYKFASTVDLEELMPSSGTKVADDKVVYTDDKGKDVKISDLVTLEDVTFTVTQVKRDPEGKILITNDSGSPYTWDMKGNLVKDEDYTNTYSVVENGMVAEVTTDHDGKAVFSADSINGLTGKKIGKIPHGLYLVTENYNPAVAKAVAPFIVALPMTTREGDEKVKEGELPRTTLLYDVYAYPKNQIPIQPKIEKYVTQINGISDTIGASTNTLNSYYNTASDDEALATNSANNNVDKSYVEDAQTHVDSTINSVSGATISDNVAVGSTNTANKSEVNEAKGINALNANEKREAQPVSNRNNEVQYILECGVPYDMLDCGKYVVEDDLEYRLIFDECSLQFKIATDWDKKTGVPTAYQELELTKGTSFNEGDKNYGDYVITIDKVDTKDCDYSVEGKQETKMVIQFTKSGRTKIYNALYPASDAKSETDSWFPYTLNYEKALKNNTAQTLNHVYDNYNYANASYFDYKNLYIFFNCALNMDEIKHTTSGVSFDNRAELRYTNYFGYEYGDDDDDGYDDHDDKEDKREGKEDKMTREKSQTQTVTVWYTGLEMLKVDGVDSNIKLANAKFKIYSNVKDAKAGKNELTASENGVEKNVFTTDKDGYLRIAGLAYSDQVATTKEYTEKSYDSEGKLVDEVITKTVYTIDQEKPRNYWLVEVQAPDGYELWKNPIQVTVGEKDFMSQNPSSDSWDLASLLQYKTTKTNYIKNYTIEVLPGTGLTSSNLVLIGVLIVVVAAAAIVFVVVRNKKKNDKGNGKKDDENKSEKLKE